MASLTIGAITTEQFLAMPDQYDASGNRVKQELIAGELVCMAHSSQMHDIVKNAICWILREFLRARPELGLSAFVEIAYAVSEIDSLAPDVSVVRTDRLLRSGERIILRAPEIAIEIVSPTDTAANLQSKISAYLTNGSASVWVVYPDQKLVQIHASGSVSQRSGDQSIEDGLLPGFTAALSQFFEGLS